MNPSHPLLSSIRALHRTIRAGVLSACHSQSLEALATVAEDAEGDTLFAVDKVSEELLLRELSRDAERWGGVVLVAEGLAGGSVALPEGRADSACRYRLCVDPIDGTRGLMYQKRPAWVLTAVAANRGPETSLSDVELAVQTEIPLVKQHLSDELWAVRGAGAGAERVNVESGDRQKLALTPSRATNIENGYTTVSRFFPGARDVLAAIDDEMVSALLGPARPGKARCFEDQYASTGGQLYELSAGHDRFIVDLRPLLDPVLRTRGEPLGLCCHPYDICTALIAEELGVSLRHPWGGRLDVPLDVTTDVAWAGYANVDLLRAIEPVLAGVLERHGLSRSGV